MGTKITIALTGDQPVSINGRTLQPGQTMLQGVVPDGLMVADVHLALRNGMFRVIDHGAERQRGRMGPAGAAVSSRSQA